MSVMPLPCAVANVLPRRDSHQHFHPDPPATRFRLRSHERQTHPRPRVATLCAAEQGARQPTGDLVAARYTLASLFRREEHCKLRSVCNLTIKVCPRVRRETLAFSTERAKRGKEKKLQGAMASGARARAAQPGAPEKKWVSPVDFVGMVNALRQNASVDIPSNIVDAMLNEVCLTLASPMS